MFSPSQQQELQNAADTLASFSAHPCGFAHELRRGATFCHPDIRRHRLGCAHWYLGAPLAVISTLSTLGILTPDERSKMTRDFERTEDELNELDQLAGSQALSQGEVGFAAMDSQREIIDLRKKNVERMLALLLEAGVIPHEISS